MLLTTVSYSGAVCVLCVGSVRVCAEEVGGGSPVRFKGKIQGTHKAGRAGRQEGKAAGRERKGGGNLLSWLTLQPTTLLWILLHRADPVSRCVLSLSLATVRRASYPQSFSCSTATALQTKAGESCCVYVCRWRGAKLKAEAKAKRREECSTKGACVLQLGLCVNVCVFVDSLECLCHGAS